MGQPHVDRLLAELSTHEFDEWLAFYSIEPWGEARADVRAGIVASTIANVNRNPKYRRKPYSPQDFMPVYDKPPKPAPTTDDMLRIAEVLNKAFGGKDLRGQRAGGGVQ